MADSLDKVKELYQAKRYREALSILEEFDESPNVLVWKSRCNQLIDDGTFLELAEIRRMLERALEIDEEYIPALIDLGYFYLLVEDDAVRARPFLEKALDIAKDNAAEIIVGLSECISDTGPEEAAKSFLRANKKLELDISKYEL